MVVVTYKYVVLRKNILKMDKCVNFTYLNNKL